VNTHIWLANYQLGNVELRHCYRLGWMASQSEVASAQESAFCIGRVKVHVVLYISSMSGDSLHCPFGKEGIRPCDFGKESLPVILSQPSQCYAEVIQHPPSSFLRPQCKVS